MQLARNKNVDIAYYTAGVRPAAKASPILLAACGGKLFDPFVRAMGASNQVISFDYRGSGRSSAPKTLDLYSSVFYTEDMMSILRKTKTGKAVVFGYSHGGYFAVNFALRYPERVEALILGEPAVFTPTEELQQRADLIAKSSYKESIALLLQQISPAIRMSPLYNKMAKAIQDNYPQPIGMEGEYRARAMHPISERQLLELKMPVLLIGGTASAIKERTMHRVAKAMPNASVFWIQGATHMFPVEKPEVVAKAVSSFLDGIRSK